MTMIDFATIIQSYPVSLQHHKEHIFKEYLQYHILEAVFSSSVAQKLCFIGGTALRLWYQNLRFSEDLDFDNKNLSFEEFDDLMYYVQNALQLKWFKVEMNTVRKWAYHCSIKFPKLLYEAGISPMLNTKILIQIDTHDQWYEYEYTRMKFDAFDTLSLVNIASPSMLLAQKLFTVFERKRMKGRDFFDILFLVKITTQPDWWFLNQTLNITTPDQLRAYLVDQCQWVDFEALQQDVSPFLFQTDNQSVKLFPEFIKQIEWKVQIPRRNHETLPKVLSN